MGQYIVQFGSNWDGGIQERDAATRFIKEIDKKAHVMAKKMGNRVVIIKLEDDGDEEIEIFSCPQRDLFQKYGHPAKQALQDAVKKHL